MYLEKYTSSNLVTYQKFGELFRQKVLQELGFILTFLPVCASNLQTQYLMTDNREIAKNQEIRKLTKIWAKEK